MFRSTPLFSTSIDPTGNKRIHVEQKIAESLFGHFRRHTLFDHAFFAVASVVETFPPEERKAAITPALMEHVKVALARWQQGLQYLAQPTREETSQMGKDLLLLILQEIHPDYVEYAGDEGHPEKPEATTLDLALGHLQGMLSTEYSTGEDEIFGTALEAVRLLKALGESSEYPYPYVELPYVPALLFPVKNPRTGNMIWIEMAPSNSGFSLTAHKRKPMIKDSNTWSHPTGMAGLHVDYYVAPAEDEPELTQKGTPRQRRVRPQEMLKVQLHDATVGPYGEPHWEIPDHYVPSAGDASIVLVRDVQRWRSTWTEEDAPVQDELHAADIGDVAFEGKGYRAESFSAETDDPR
ncbi:MAG TPA: hypothetical protein VFV38_01375 [Ktedonobacteraceae bacterium]|nr:hypothetical protein [Ktedonobacteraceae bacterium]